MRIVIEIEGLEVSVKMPTESQATMAPSATAPAVVVAAARIGAQDAGPAPATSVQTLGAPQPFLVSEPDAPQPFMASGSIVPAASANDLNAGAAPGTPSMAKGSDAQLVSGATDIAAGAAPGTPDQASDSDGTRGQ